MERRVQGGQLGAERPEQHEVDGHRTDPEQPAQHLDAERERARERHPEGDVRAVEPGERVAEDEHAQQVVPANAVPSVAYARACEPAGSGRSFPSDGGVPGRAPPPAAVPRSPAPWRAARRRTRGPRPRGRRASRAGAQATKEPSATSASTPNSGSFTAEIQATLSTCIGCSPKSRAVANAARPSPSSWRANRQAASVARRCRISERRWNPSGAPSPRAYATRSTRTVSGRQYPTEPRRAAGSSKPQCEPARLARSGSAPVTRGVAADEAQVVVDELAGERAPEHRRQGQREEEREPDGSRAWRGAPARCATRRALRSCRGSSFRTA